MDNGRYSARAMFFDIHRGRGGQQQRKPSQQAVMDHGAESLGACPPLQYFGTQRLVGLQRG